MEPLQWRALGRPPPALRFGVRPALVVVAQMTPNKLHMHVVVLLQKQNSLILLMGAIFKRQDAAPLRAHAPRARAAVMHLHVGVLLQRRRRRRRQQRAALWHGAH